MDACEDGKLENYNGVCSCGTLDVSSDRAAELVIDAILLEQVFNNFTYIPPLVNPFTLIVGSNPFKPLVTPESSLPW